MYILISGGIKTTTKNLETSTSVTCSVSYEQSIALKAFSELRELGFDSDVELQRNGTARLYLWEMETLLQAQRLLKTVLGVSKLTLNKCEGAGKSWQYARGELFNQKLSLTVYAPYVASTFEGCHVEYEEIEVPETVVPAHKEKRAKIVCDGGD